MNGSIKVVVGILLILGGLWVYLSKLFSGFFGNQLILIIKLLIGNIPGVIILIGLVFMLLGFSDLKNQ